MLCFSLFISLLRYLFSFSQLSIFFSISNLISCSLAFIRSEFRLSTLTSEIGGGFKGSRARGGGDLEDPKGAPPIDGGGIAGCCSFNNAE